MTGMVALITGIAVSGLVMLSWLISILYLRRRRRAMQDPSATSGAAPAALIGTGQDAHSIEAWLARAAALPDGRAPQPAGMVARDQARLEAIARRHFPTLAVPHPHLHLFGITGAEKRLLAWVSRHTGLPDPFDALDELTGDPDELRRATEVWTDTHADVLAQVDRLSTAAARLRQDWSDPEAARFFTILAAYLTELDGLAADIRTTGDALRGLQAEAALAEGTIAGLINLLIGSFGGYLVESVLTVGALTPAVAVQAQVELTWVIKQIALALARLQAIYTNTRHILVSVHGFQGLSQLSAHFQLGEVARIDRAIDTVG